MKLGDLARTSDPEQPGELHVEDLVDEFVGQKVGERARRTSCDAASDQRLSQAETALGILVLLHVVNDEGTLLDSVEDVIEKGEDILLHSVKDEESEQ